MIALCLPKLLPLHNPSEAGRAREQIQRSLSLFQVKTYIPKVPKHSLVPHHLNSITDSPPSSLMPEPEHSTEDASHEALFVNESPEGPSLTHRAFVPMPPICSDSTVHSEEVSHQSRTAGLMSSEHPSDDDAKSTESIFLTQVTAPSCLHSQLQCSQVPAAPEQPPERLHTQAASQISLGLGAGQSAEARHYLSLSTKRYLTSHAFL